jgi:Na+/H+ antiporter NhaD/arsenite permease-like protein
LIALVVLPLQEVWLAIDATTIIFLLTMMVINANLSYAEFFTQALSVLLSITRSHLGLLITLTLGSGILFALSLHDTFLLLFTPLTLSLTQALLLNPNLLAIAGVTKYRFSSNLKR